MVDLVSIGVSGLSAYQRALATTGNNIANLQTEGYVRQRSSLQPAGQDNLSRISLGNGVRYAAVERMYDQFAEENLQRASSDLKGEEALLTQLQSLQDALGSSNAGLHGALQEFFNAARALEAAPASSGTRAGFLAAAEGVASRMRNLGTTAETLERNTRTEIEGGVAQLNSYLSEIAQLNKELLKRSSDAEQPMQLLDRRDAVLKKISESIGVTVQLSNGGAAKIYAGDSAAGVALVDNGTVHSVTAQFDKVDFGRVQFVLDAGSNPTLLPNVRNGTLGGLLTFRSQGLGQSADRLDAIALAFGRSVNQLFRDGLDSLGRPGRDLFYVGPRFSTDGSANAGTARLGVSVVDPAAVQTHAFDMRFDAGSSLWTVRDTSTGIEATGANDIVLAGVRFSVQGFPKNGDTFRITPESRPASSFETLIKEPAEVVTAARVASTASANNISTAVGAITITPNRPANVFRRIDELLPRTSGPPYVETLVSATSKPSAVIPAGYGNIRLTSGASSGEIAVFTRDGRQISGPALTTSAAASLVSTGNGFFAGAKYSAAYLNSTGADAYLDHGFVNGMYAEAAAQTDVDGKITRSPASILSEPIDLTSFPANSTNKIRVNGITVTVNNDADTKGTVATAADLPVTANDGDRYVVATTGKLWERSGGSWTEGAVKTISMTTIAAAINAARASTGVVTDVVGDRLQFTTLNQISSAAPAIATGAYVTINGVRIDFTSADEATTTNPLQKFVDKINDANIGVSASLSGLNLVLTNSSGQTGKPFTIGENSIDLAQGEVFDDSPIALDFDTSGSSESIQKFGLRRGFAMKDPLAEDLLVFGVKDTGGLPASLSLAGTFDKLDIPRALQSDQREYLLRFDGDQGFTITDVATNTEVGGGSLDLASRQLSFGNWTLSFNGVPEGGDTFVVRPTEDPLGDNRVASALGDLQNRKDLLASDQTLQQEYESLVNQIGAQTVQAEIGKNAQKVVYDHANEARERVSGVNLDEELSDLLRYQQAYQANAQVIQTANRLFDALIQRL